MSVGPSVTDGRKEEQRGRAKPEWLVVLMHVTDTANEQKFGLVELLESLSGDGTRAGGVGRRVQSILDWLILVLTTLGNQVEVMSRELPHP